MENSAITLAMIRKFENPYFIKDGLETFPTYIYTKADAFNSSKIPHFIAPKTVFIRASGPVFENPAKLGAIK